MGDIVLGPKQNVWLYYDPSRKAWTAAITPHDQGGLGSGLNAGAAEIITGQWSFADNLGIADSDASHYLRFDCSSDLTVDRILTLAPGDAARTITLTGNPTLDDWFDQNVKTTGSPTFVTPLITSVEVGHATDTTLSRASAGVLAVEGISLARSADKLSFFAATTSAELAGVISDETGSGALVFADTPTLATPVIGAATGTSLVLTGNLSAEDLLIEDSDASHYLTITTTSNLTVARTLTLVPGDASRTITLTGDPTLADWFDQSVKVAASPTFADITLSGGDLIASANLVIRRNTADGSDTGSLILAAGGANGITRGASIEMYGNENAGTGAIDVNVGNVSGSGFRVRDVGGNNALSIVGSDGSTAFVSTAQVAWTLNSTHASGGQTQWQRSGVERGRVGINIFNAPADDFEVYSVANLYLSAVGDVRFNQDIVFTDNQVIRRSTSDGSDSGTISIAGGGAFAATRGGNLLVAGNENADPGLVLVQIGNVASSKFSIGRADGTESFQLLGSDGSVTCTSSAQVAWVLNSTHASGGQTSWKRSGTERGRVGINIVNAPADDFEVYSINNLYLSAATDVRMAQDLVFTGNHVLRRSTSDTTDNGSLILTGGGASGITRGSSVSVFGNENAQVGSVFIDLGNVSGSGFRVQNAAGTANAVYVDGATSDMTLGGQLFITDGSASNPAIAFTNDTDTGIALASTGILEFSAAGSQRAIVSASGVGIGTTTFGTSAEKVLSIANGTAPTTSPADHIQLYSVDLSAGNATLGLRTETSVVAESPGAATRTLRVVINGTSYRLLMVL